jgi:pilus assembly protein CpaF
MSNQEFNVGHFINKKNGASSVGNHSELIQEDNFNRFIEICDIVKLGIDKIEEGEKQKETANERQMQALLGMADAIEYYKVNIREILRERKITETWFPTWYESFEDAVFQELYGFAGVNEWIRGTREELKDSSSAKIIGDRIFFRINGKPVLQPQSISKDRRDQLRTSLLLSDPRKKKTDEQHEVFIFDDTLDRIRVKIATDKVAKKTQDTFTFRKFIVKDYTFEAQAELHTIPKNAIDFFKAFAVVGYNVMFVGPPGCGKSTFFTTWQKYEDDSLEGVQIENDSEIPWHIIKPAAPITQLVPNEKNYRTIMKDILREDPDYVMVAEARDALAFYIAVEAANRGTSRVKSTSHLTDMIDICLSIANRIVGEFGGDLLSTIITVAKSFNYIVQLDSLTDKSQKRLNSIWEVRYDPLAVKIEMHNICKYRMEEDDWVWAYDIGEERELFGLKSSPEAFGIFKNELKRLAEEKPMEGNHVFTPSYDHLFRRGN